MSNDPIAEHAPAEVRKLLAELCTRIVHACDGRVPPLGWSGIAPAIPAHAGTVGSLPAWMELTPTEQWMVAAAISQDVDGRFVGVWQLLGGRVDIVRPRVA